MRFSPRILTIIVLSSLLLACMACAAAGLTWAATPGYLSARLTGVSRFEAGVEPCINSTGRVVQGGALYITRLFVSPQNPSEVAIYYISQGWDALSVYVEHSGLIRRTDPQKFDLFLTRAIMFSGITLYRNIDDSTRIEMRSTMILCPT